MTAIPDTLPLTYEHIRHIYYAGTQRGNDEAVAFDWGSTPSGKWHDNLVEALHEILNEGRHHREPTFLFWREVEAWVAAGESAHASAIEARRAETGTGSVHESAVGEAETP